GPPAEPAPRARDPDLARRLRDGLLVAEPAPRAALRRAEDRPLLRAQARTPAGDRARDRRPGAWARARGRGRGRGEGRAALRAPRDGLRLRPGLPVRSRPRGRGGHRPDAGRAGDPEECRVLTVGDTLPDFRLRTIAGPGLGSEVTPASFPGQWLVLLYWPAD